MAAADHRAHARLAHGLSASREQPFHRAFTGIILPRLSNPYADVAKANEVPKKRPHCEDGFLKKNFPRVIPLLAKTLEWGEWGVRHVKIIFLFDSARSRC